MLKIRQSKKNNLGNDNTYFRVRWLERRLPIALDLVGVGGLKGVELASMSSFPSFKIVATSSSSKKYKSIYNSMTISISRVYVHETTAETHHQTLAYSMYQTMV